MAAKRTTHRSSAGKKLYAVRDKKGQFEDIQSYKKAHGQDIKRKSKSESARKRGDTFYELRISSPPFEPLGGIRVSRIRDAVRASKKK